MPPRYLRPATLNAAMTALAEDPNLRIVAGATDIYPAQVARMAAGGPKCLGPLLDVTGIAGLRGVEERVDHWWIGAATTWSDIVGADLPPLFDGLRTAARAIGGVQIQNRGTIAGNIATASPAGDSIPCLLALDAEVECFGSGSFCVPLDKFIVGYRKTILDGQLVTGVRVPKRAGRGWFLKLGARSHLVISIAMVAGVIDSDHVRRVTHARIAVGACSAVAQRLRRLEARLNGSYLGDVRVELDDLASLRPIDDVRGSGDYRRAAALQLVQDLLDAARGREA